MRQQQRRGLVLAGGGTAGHVYPGLELVENLSSSGVFGEEVIFCGTPSGSGRDLVEKSGFEFVSMNVKGLSRSKPLSNIRVLWLFAVAVARAMRILRKGPPRVVVGLGGYSSLPVLIAAALIGIPRTILQEDATLGVSNRVASWLSSQIAVAFPAPAEIFGKKGLRVRPAVRSEIAALGTTRRSAEAKERIGVERSRRLVLIAGGSLGAGPVNDAALDCRDRWRDRGDIALIHLAGERFLDEVKGRLAAISEDSDQIEYRLEGFNPDFATLLEAADLAITRGGATTVGELAASGTPAIVMPSSFVTANHQEPNARALEAAGGCVVITDSEVARIPTVADDLLADEGRLEAMRTAGPASCEADRTFADVVAAVGGFGD